LATFALTPSEGEGAEVINWYFSYFEKNKLVPSTLEGRICISAFRSMLILKKFDTTDITFPDNDALAKDIHPAVEVARGLYDISVDNNGIFTPNLIYFYYLFLKNKKKQKKKQQQKKKKKKGMIMRT
jgi:hypothetical protein